MSISVSFDNEYQYFSNTEAVTLFRKTSDGTFDGGTAVGNALRLEQRYEMIGGDRGIVRKKSLAWFLWASQTGATAVKNGDVIQDSTGARWVIWETKTEAWGARYYVETTLQT